VRTRHAGVGDDAIARLAREARTVAKLQHANIVTVYAVKRLRDGGLALVMQLVPGQTLKQAIVDRGALPVEETERILKDVAQALAYAHAHGVVHRDVKPENIFLDSETGHAMLSDFGIAHSSEFDSRLTMTGAAIGTPAYMSPEQIDGAPANARSDVYSLGLVSWEMLTGERPWEGETLYNVIFKQKHEELPSIDELRPGVPARLQYIVERMLQKKPAARWAGAEGLLGILTAWIVPTDWRQWEEAHQRRKDLVKAAAKGKAPTPTATAAAAAMATVRFPRPRTPSSEQVVIPAPAARRSATPIVESIVEDDDDTPSWASEAAPAGHWRRNLAIGAVALLVVVGSVAGYAVRAGRLQIPGAFGQRFADAPKPTIVVATPETPARAPDATDSIAKAVTDSVTAASTAGAPVPLVVGAVPPGVSSVVKSPAGSVAPAVAVPALPAAAARNLSPGAPAAAAIGPPKLAAPDVASFRPTDDRGIIAAGGRHSCMLNSGKVFCWGANDRGQLGDGESESRDVAGGIALDLEFAQISAGIAHSCGVTRSGDAYCWGSDDRGQLGDATTTSRNAPVRVAGNLSFQLVRTGVAHTCGLTASGEIACWGLNDHGQLGDGTQATRFTPVTLKLAQRFISLTVGWNHSCAIAFDGVAYCWGDNSAGQLGDGTHNDQKLPMPVIGGLHYTSIAAGSGHTCAITDGGDAFCWGRNTYGQLGTGNEADQASPMRVEGATRFASVSVGGVHSCARTRTGQAFCWGRNTYGQLGDGTTTNRDTPARVSGGMTFAALSATAAHTCGTTTDGETLCWGYNTEGQLGDGTRNNHSRPMRITLPGR
jgi:alpha-tubulin suppressor-like RCC1 family protein